MSNKPQNTEPDLSTGVQNKENAEKATRETLESLGTSVKNSRNSEAFGVAVELGLTYLEETSDKLAQLGSVDKQDSQEERIVIHRLFSDGGKHGAVIDEQYGMAVSAAVFEGNLRSGRAQARQSSFGDGWYFLDSTHRLAVA